MPVRLCLQPVVLTDGGARVALSSTLVDPGRPPSETVDDDGNPILVPKTYGTAPAISDGAVSEPDLIRNNCFAIVAGVDMSNLDSASGIITLFEAGTDQPLVVFRDWLGSTPAGLGWNNQRQNRIRNRITNAGGSATGLTSTTPLWRWANAAGLVFSPTWDTRLALTSVEGA